MIPNINKKLEWLEQNSHLLKGINRGIERETLRIQPDAHLAQTPHPQTLGSALTHPWITTDFAESLFEFVTPVMQDVDQLLAFLRDVHRYSVHHIGDELLWPLSMPCFIDVDDKIKLAQYGKSNQGKMKTLYREGLKNRYGALMQTISGIHYNFSLPLAFWQEKYQQEPNKDIVSKGYFNIIRNYYRFGWVIPYLFGASPALCSCFLRNKKTALPFEQLKSGGLYLPYATSLRLSDLGYTNTAQKDLGITFNNLETYVEGLKKATRIKNPKYEEIGVNVDGTYRQLNANVLQIENEFYAPIRPKRVTQSDESPSDALLRGGVEYIEVRSLDINPFTAIGIDSDQVCFLDLFLIWCALADAPEMSAVELECVMENWKTVITAGREPNQTVSLGCHENKEPLKDIGKALFVDLARVAQIIDNMDKKEQYLPVCLGLARVFEDPSLTLSAKVLDLMKEQGIGHLGLSLAKEYKAQLLTEPLEMVSEDRFIEKTKESWLSQQKIEQSDMLSFDDYLKQHVVS